MKKLLFWIPLIVLLAYAPQTLQIFIACGPKNGLVVDADTGAPIPGAAVVATSYFAQPAGAWRRAYDGPVYRTVVWTDARGGYSIPWSWRFAKIGFPGVGLRLHATVMAVKPGHINPDDRVTMQYDKYGMRVYQPRSISAPPRVESIGVFGVTLAPLKLALYEFDFKAKVTYYSALLLSKRPLLDTDPSDVGLLDYLRAYIFDGVCQIQSDERLDLATVSGVVDFSENPLQTYGIIRKFEPEFFGKDIPTRPTLSAGHLCAAINRVTQ